MTGDRPPSSCLTHRPPREGRPWHRSDPGYSCCTACYDRLHRWLSPLGVDDEGRPDNIPTLYAQLDPRPGKGGHGRHAPGFGSRSPASDHVLAMRDPRTTSIDPGDPCSAPAVLREWVTYVWDERYDDAALDQPDYRWRRRGLPTTVEAAAMWLDRNLDWLTRQEIVAEFHIEVGELVQQLHSANRDTRQPPVGQCIEILPNGECQASIHMPRGEKPRASDEPITDLPELKCPACGSRYTGRRLILLRMNREKQKAAPDAGTPAA